MNDKNYKNRIVERAIKNLLRITGAVAIQGPKWCGKTECAKRFANTTFDVADSTANFANRKKALIDPKSTLKGTKPILVDEWQEVPSIWDAVKQEVDNLETNGNFILTGSATPEDYTRIHSGAGRISRIRMRPMSLMEIGVSSGAIKLMDLFDNKNVAPHIGVLSLDSILDICTIGGWPRNILNKSSPKDAFLVNKNYLDTVVDAKIKDKNGHAGRDHEKMKRLIESVARNVSTLVTLETIYKDIESNKEIGISKPTMMGYLDVLKKLFIIEQIPAWSLNIRSSARLRKTSKTILADPSLAIAALGKNNEYWSNDLRAFGFIFENLVLRDLLTYAESCECSISHYHDNSDLEIDAIITRDDGKWGAIEIKLGIYDIEKAIKNLLRFKNKMSSDEHKNQPAFLAIIVGAGAVAELRKDGVYIIPVDCLGV